MKKQGAVRLCLGAVLWAVPELMGIGPYSMLVNGAAFDTAFGFGVYLLMYFSTSALCLLPPTGLLYTLCGTVLGFWCGVGIALLGSTLCFATSYFRGRRVKEAAPTDGLLSHLGAGAFLAAFVLRSLRFLPAEYVGKHIGKARLSFAGYMGGSLMGALPSVLFYVSLGAALA